MVAHQIGHAPAKQIEQPKPLPELLQLDEVTEEIVEEALAEDVTAAEPEVIEPEEIETPAAPPRPPVNAASPLRSELLALASMSPDERRARAMKSANTRGTWLSPGSGSSDDL